MDRIETQYYNSVTGKPTKGRTIPTYPICCLCYDDHDIVSSSGSKRNRDVGGKNPSPLCWHYYGGTESIPVPTYGGCSNGQEMSAQQRAGKKRMHSRGVEKGYKKPRKPYF